MYLEVCYKPLRDLFPTKHRILRAECYASFKLDRQYFGPNYIDLQLYTMYEYIELSDLPSANLKKDRSCQKPTVRTRSKAKLAELASFVAARGFRTDKIDLLLEMYGVQTRSQPTLSEFPLYSRDNADIPIKARCNRPSSANFDQGCKFLSLVNVYQLRTQPCTAYPSLFAVIRDIVFSFQGKYPPANLEDPGRIITACRIRDQLSLPNPASKVVLPTIDDNRSPQQPDPDYTSQSLYIGHDPSVEQEAESYIKSPDAKALINGEQTEDYGVETPLPNLVYRNFDNLIGGRPQGQEEEEEEEGEHAERVRIDLGSTDRSTITEQEQELERRQREIQRLYLESEMLRLGQVATSNTQKSQQLANLVISQKQEITSLRLYNRKLLRQVKSSALGMNPIRPDIRLRSYAANYPLGRRKTQQPRRISLISEQESAEQNKDCDRADDQMIYDYDANQASERYNQPSEAIESKLLNNFNKLIGGRANREEEETKRVRVEESIYEQSDSRNLIPQLHNSMLPRLHPGQRDN